jgi:hypothetical protein
LTQTVRHHGHRRHHHHYHHHHHHHKHQHHYWITAQFRALSSSEHAATEQKSSLTVRETTTEVHKVSNHEQ